MNGHDVVYHDIVLRDDLPRLPRNIQRRILLAVEH